MFCPLLMSLSRSLISRLPTTFIGHLSQFFVTTRRHCQYATAIYFTSRTPFFHLRAMPMMPPAPATADDDDARWAIDEREEIREREAAMMHYWWDVAIDERCARCHWGDEDVCASRRREAIRVYVVTMMMPMMSAMTMMMSEMFIERHDKDERWCAAIVTPIRRDTWCRCYDDERCYSSDRCARRHNTTRALRQCHMIGTRGKYYVVTVILSAPRWWRVTPEILRRRVGVVLIAALMRGGVTRTAVASRYADARHDTAADWARCR